MKKGIIFDLDGVIVDTAKYHYLAWKKMAAQFGYDFTEEENEAFKGVSRIRCMELLLEMAQVEASQEQINEWLFQKKWNSIAVEYMSKTETTKTDSLEKFIYEHYYGYTKINEHQTEEYQLRHPSWKTHKITDYKIDCDFEAMYGKSFSILNNTQPSEVFIAEGSDVSIYWKRNKIRD
jgi:FMN phosphatase YigB (HAD superfamily)